MEDFSWHRHRHRVRSMRHAITIDMLIVLGIVLVVPVMTFLLWRAS